MGIAGGLWRVETRVMPWISFWPDGSADGCRNSHCTRIGSRGPSPGRVYCASDRKNRATSSGEPSRVIDAVPNSR